MTNPKPDISEYNRRLADFQGGIGTLFRYECGHAKLFIQLTTKGGDPFKEIYLLCSPVERIEADISWPKNMLQIRENLQHKGWMELFDDANHVRVSAAFVSLYDKLPY